MPARSGRRGRRGRVLVVSHASAVTIHEGVHEKCETTPAAGLGVIVTGTPGSDAYRRSYR
jgi:hypothetical protein